MVNVFTKVILILTKFCALHKNGQIFVLYSSYFAQPHPNPSPKERELVDESEDQNK